MSRRKYKKGEPVVNLAELLEHDWFIVCFGMSKIKTMHKEVLASWPLRVCEKFVDGGQIYIANRITNGEYFEGQSDDMLMDMLDEDLCNYCPLPEEMKGVHCYGGLPVMCEGVHCGEALKAWKEECVE